MYTYPGFTSTDAGHTYEIANMGDGTQTLQFIKSEDQEGKLVTIIDGTTNEVVICVLINRIKYLNEKLPSPENNEALFHLEIALEELQKRTLNRKDRGVEGTNQA